MDKNGQPVANAHPSKAFFIEMLTKDITLSDCILDLIDNSIDRLIISLGLDVSVNFFTGTRVPRVNALIEISFTASSFEISDNSGGISVKDATEQVFLLGNPVTVKRQTGLGVFGIGMKRALFKIGRQISITSHTTDEEWRIDILVDKWENEPDQWNFPFTYARKKGHKTGGTEIHVSSLAPTVADQFLSKSFKTILIEKISRAYALFLKAGVRIKVNSQDLKSRHSGAQRIERASCGPTSD